VQNSQLQSRLGQEVLELTFVRRHPKLGWSNVRAIIGTTNYSLLNGMFGKQVLLFQPPKGVGMGYDYRSKGLCVIWDIFRQEYRVFGAEQVSIRQQWSVRTEEEQEIFEKYFYDNLINMSNQDKLDFMGYIGMNAGGIPNGYGTKPQPVQNAPQPTPQKQTQTLGRVIKDRFAGFFNRVKKWFSSKK
jgi:hypothetical protein